MTQVPFDATLNKKIFEELAAMETGPCVSIFLPTHSSGKEVLNQEDRLTFKNLLKQIREEMEKRHFEAPAIAKFLEPLHGMLENAELWRQQDRGLAVFAAGNYLRYFTLPLTFEPFFFFSTEFYLKPLLPFFMGAGDFFLLTLNFHEVQLYRGNREGMEEVLFEPPLPQRLEEVVGFDYEEKYKGLHSMKMGGHAIGTFHGAGEWQADEKDETLSFFRAVDKEIVPALGGKNIPLVVAALDHLAPIYREANTYPFLYPEPLTGNPKHVPLPDLHKKAWDMLAFHFDKERRQQAELLSQLRDTERTATDIREVIPAAAGGRVDALFLDKNEEIWGVYDKTGAEVRVDNKQNPANTALTNMAAVQVFLNGGNVYITERETLPLPYTPVNALYRY